MKKIFIGYYTLVVTLGIMLAINGLLLSQENMVIDLSFLLILVLTIVSETVYHFMTQNTAMTLSSAIIIFACAVLPFSEVVLILFLFTLLSRLAGVIRREFKHIFNMKWLFNFAVFTILAKTTLILYNVFEFRYLKIEDQVIVIILLCMVHNFINIILTYLVVSMSSQVNAFKSFRITEYLVFTFYNVMFVILLWFGYSSYNEVALVYLGILVVPLQKSIMIQTKSEEISHMLTVDPLTKAKNRQAFEDELYEKLDKEMPFALIFIDLDKFKYINDTYGHLVGDEVLGDLVSKIKDFLRPKDHVYRFGGDEFCILTYDMGYGDILYEILRKNCGHFHIFVSQEELTYEFTMSLVKYDGLSKETYRDIINEADKAMYLRKQES